MQGKKERRGGERKKEREDKGKEEKMRNKKDFHSTAGLEPATFYSKVNCLPPQVRIVRTIIYIHRKSRF